MTKLVFKYKLSLLLLMVCVIGNVISTLALPAYLSVVINIQIPQRDFSSLFNTGGKMLIFVLLSFLCNIGIGFFSAIISAEIGSVLRKETFIKASYFSQTEFDHFSSSSLITRTTNDVVQIQTFINLMLRISLMAPFMCIGGIIMAFQKSFSMSMILFISIPVMIAFVFAIGKISTPLSIKMQTMVDHINLIIREKITGVRVARAFGTEQFEEEKFQELNEKFMKNAVRMNATINILIPGLSFILYLTMVALIGFGGYITINNTNGLPVGDIIAVIQYVMQIMMSVMMLSMVFMMYPRASVSLSRIDEVLDTKEALTEKQVSNPTNKQVGTVVFDHVSFQFPNAQDCVLSDISFSSGPGEVTAIIGSTGSGKSTLLHLIPRFFDATKGTILVNGTDVRDFTFKDLRDQIGFVPQKSFLFQGTIEDNLKFAHPDATDLDLEHAAKIAQAYSFILEKEDTFESLISQGGTNVSGGQRQRLCIARAVMRKPDVYLFDDSFSALDYKTDAALRKALKSEASLSTIVMVAQRINTIIEADRILVLDQGRCVGMGTHLELMKTCSVYQEIARSQFIEGEENNE